jgi:hypothetical protein
MIYIEFELQSIIFTIYNDLQPITITYMTIYVHLQ